LLEVEAVEVEVVEVEKTELYWVEYHRFLIKILCEIIKNICNDERLLNGYKRQYDDQQRLGNKLMLILIQ